MRKNSTVDGQITFHSLLNTTYFRKNNWWGSSDPFLSLPLGQGSCRDEQR